MTAWICLTCGNQHADSTTPPETCRVCRDPRQYVGWDGQRWASLTELAHDHRCDIRSLEAGLWGIGVEPQVAIGQRALLVQTAGGNLLWDIPGFVDRAAMEAVADMGGVAAISASHPHFYGVMVEWAQAFQAPIWLPSADRDWVMRPDPAVEFYDDEIEPVPGVRLIRTGGHFPGSAVAHWRAGADGRGVLLTGDTITVTQDRDRVSIMWSYPNLIPLDEETVLEVARRVEPLAYDRIYGGWWGRVVDGEAREKVAASIDRYIAMLRHGPP